VTTQAQRLAQARLNAGYANPTDAAEAFNWKKPSYYCHENGSRALTRVTAAKYGKAFKVSPAWLLMNQGRPEDTPMGQLQQYDRDTLLLAFASLLEALLPEMDKDEVHGLVGVALTLVELHHMRKRTVKDFDKLSRAVKDAATFAAPPESE